MGIGHDGIGKGTCKRGYPILIYSGNAGLRLRSAEWDGRSRVVEVLVLPVSSSDTPTEIGRFVPAVVY